MRRCLIISFSFLVIVLNVAATGMPLYPHDVEDFIGRREICDHFRGEDPYDAERAKFLAEQIEEFCSGTDKELQHLKTKYEDDEEILRILNRFEEKIETNSGA